MKNRKSSGQSLLEFAIILPILLLLVMGVFDLGGGIYYYSAIQNAAREGARYGAVNHCDAAGIKNQAKQMAGLGAGLYVSFLKYQFRRKDGLVVTLRRRLR